MDLKEIEKTYNQIIQNLKEYELKKAIDLLFSLLTNMPDPSLLGKLSESNTTYRYMLQYMTEGKSDPERKNILLQLQQNLYSIANEYYEEVLRQLSPSLFYRKQRSLAVLKEKTCKAFIEEYYTMSDKMQFVTDTEDDEIFYGMEIEKENLLSSFFHKVWLFGINGEEKEIQSFLLAENKSMISQLLVSALTLRLTQKYDEEELLSFFHLYPQTSDALHWRILTGLLIMLQKWEKEIRNSEKLMSALETVREYPLFLQELRVVILQFIRTFETEEIGKKLQEEIYPEVMKISPKLQNKINLNELLNDPTYGDEHPEWKEALNASGITEKIQEINDLQMEGADVMMTTFAMLKNFPFFREFSNWFLPFATDHSSLRSMNPRKEVSTRNFVETLQQSSFICNSDKYSFCFSVMQMPSNYRETVLQSFHGDGSEMNKAEESDNLNKPLKDGETYTKQYVQDLYRFYKLHPDKKDFLNIFDYSLSLHHSSLILSMISDRESLNIMGAFYFKKKRYKEALEIFEIQISNNMDSAELYQKAGYCLQMLGDCEQGLRYYRMAHGINSEDFWTIRRIALCYRQLKQPEKALEYYMQAERLQPDNISLIISKGHCYLELKDYEEALKCYFKADYLDPKSHKTWQPIAWCCFLTGRYEEARKYYSKILDEKPKTQDYLNAGHVEWRLGDRTQAVKFYIRGIETDKGGIENFLDLLQQDSPELIENGINKDEIQLMKDQVRYTWEKE